MEQIDCGPPITIPGPRLLLGVGNKKILELIIDTGEPGPGNSMVAHVDKAEFFGFFTILSADKKPFGSKGMSLFDKKNKQTVAIIRDKIYPGSVFVAIINPNGKFLVSRRYEIADFLDFIRKEGIRI